MIITVAWMDEETVIADPGRLVATDLGERHKFKTVPIAKAVCWALKGGEHELAKAQKYAAGLNPPGAVFCYPPGTKETLAKTRQDMLDATRRAADDAKGRSVGGDGKPFEHKAKKVKEVKDASPLVLKFYKAVLEGQRSRDMSTPENMWDFHYGSEAPFPWVEGEFYTELASGKTTRKGALKYKGTALPPEAGRVRLTQAKVRGDATGFDPSTGQNVHINPGYASAPESLSARAMREATGVRQTFSVPDGDAFRRLIGACTSPGCTDAAGHADKHTPERNKHKHTFDCLEDKTGRVICGKG